MTERPKIIVLDDDPTGSQTVHSCLLLLQWDVDTLVEALQDNCPIFFVLTNTRALPSEQAAQVTREVCRNLKKAIQLASLPDYLIVSRSDSTLRGHYPLETDVIAEELGPFSAHFLIPAFFEGGRITRNSTHYLIIDGRETPVHETEFAKDSVFGYHHSYLPLYVEEKTKGKIKAEQVERFLLDDIRRGVQTRLRQLENNQCVVVDGETQEDFDRFAQDILTVAKEGKKFLLRSAASILTSLAGLGPQPIPPAEMAKYKPNNNRGVVIVGSHVKKTTQQLNKLLSLPDTYGIEVDVAILKDDLQQRDNIIAKALAEVKHALAEDKTPVVYTSREELTFPSVHSRLQFGKQVSSVLMDIVRGLPRHIGFLISKGGITSNDVLSDGLSLRVARLLGQIIPGCSVITTPDNHPLFPHLPVVLFPGNVGDENSLVTVYQRLSRTLS
ncbi:MAG: four-carbon acid sugar kinase family protein [Geminocystis sp.]|nr:four-carbon acid sugar kinase family protein [Geminocystis sp.]MCS7148479.1 four-carbon acid sugar kinase family protein [Geminocystis sp.]MCX8079435.1 four-carbon acid sugar kinase family protein [Geminocystis sp.]MDW8114947.1 four-carbon acid sugar kinase family protein [Geminocystis sp.]HIK36675.1 four-carbon acid sugar kinase family protein [Geminocystis sp. M7585_C2015_104]